MNVVSVMVGAPHLNVVRILFRMILYDLFDERVPLLFLNGHYNHHIPSYNLNNDNYHVPLRAFAILQLP